MGGPPGKGSPSSRATLSNASPAASSTVAPNSVTRSPPTCGTSSRDECPPDTSRATHGSSSGPCSSRSTATCADRWLTPYSGFPRASANALAAATPTSSAPASPGPAVTATASTSCAVTPAVSKALRRVGTIACRCARLATSGTTPPKRACSSTLLAIASASSVVPRTRPIPVSSQDVSKPSTSGSSEVDTHHHRIHPAEGVVAAASADLDPAVCGVERLSRVVVGAHLQERLGRSAVSGFGHEIVD